MKLLNFFKKKNLLIILLPLFIACYLLFSMISISISQIFISLALIFWIIILVQKREKFTFPSFFWPLIAYIALSLISSFLSINPKVSLKDSKELLLFIIIPIVYVGFFQEKTLKKANLALLVSASVSCFYTYFYALFKASRGEVIKGFMGHRMTQAGLLLLFSCMALSMFLFMRGRIRYLWGVGFLLAFFALILTQTRSAWIGLVIASSIILCLYKPKYLIFVPLAVAFFYFTSPQTIKERALSIFSLKGYNIYRIEYMRAGMKIIKEYPLLGTGPDTVDIVFQDPKYELSEKAKKNVHLHNNILQIAAERGIPTLLAWLTFMVWLFISFFKLLKNKDPTLRPFVVTALAALFALSTAGLFEYNFGDSEITALFLYLITVPFSLLRIQKKASNIYKNEIS